MLVELIDSKGAKVRYTAEELDSLKDKITVEPDSGNEIGLVDNGKKVTVKVIAATEKPVPTAQSTNGITVEKSVPTSPKVAPIKEGDD